MQNADELYHVSFEGIDPPRPLLSRNSASFFKTAHSAAFPRISTEQHDEFVEWVVARAGIDPKNYRPAALNRRIPACLRALRTGSREAARHLLENNAGLLPRVLNALLIGCTEFFRDRQVFDLLQLHVLPFLLREKAGISILSAGCSSGQELYSLAMILDEAGALERCILCGVDCRPDALAKARSGLFQFHDFKGLPEYMQKRYFRRECAVWKLDPELGEKVQWQQVDLLKGLSCFHNRFDLILFRNVAIYMQETAANLVWHTLSSSLLPNGFLITGKAERPPDELRFQRIIPSVYRKA